MRLIRAIFAVVIIVGFGAQFGFSQGPPPDPASMAQNQAQFLTTLLSLTTTQQQQVQNALNSAATSESALRDQENTARETLESAVRSNDSAGISQAATALGNLAGQRAEIRAKADAAIYQLLTSAQRSKLNQLKALGPGFGGPGGPGGLGARD